MEDVKPGYKTTEFYMTVFTHLVTLFTLSGIFPVDSELLKILTLVSSALSQSTYTVSRGMTKSLPKKILETIFGVAKDLAVKKID